MPIGDKEPIRTNEDELGVEDTIFARAAELGLRPELELVTLAADDPNRAGEVVSKIDAKLGKLVREGAGIVRRLIDENTPPPSSIRPAIIEDSIVDPHKPPRE